MSGSRIWTELDFDAEGKHSGYLHLPHSVNDSAYGTIAIPIAVIRNGKGPTVLIMGGIHGDEYEAQIVICRLMRELAPDHLRGTVILIPAVNLPAAMAGTRVSPLDDLNMNRCFPGDPNGRPTEQLAHYVDSVLLPRCDVWLDWHSGGWSLDYMPFASIHRFRDAALTETNLRALAAFGGPVGVVWSFFDEPRMAKGCAERHGLVYLGSEFGGGGSVNRAGVALAYDGTLRVLKHLGVLAPTAPFAITPPQATRYFDIAGRNHNIYAPHPGLFEPCCGLGEAVRAGALVGLIHYVDDPLRPPATVHARTDGTVLCLRHPGRTRRGDCIVQLGTEIPTQAGTTA
ncbi:MAG: succinylglutamate desuccinylase/aspartoacylase family protein [Parvibaculaceae bacterium]